jgi:hypothetical protein
MNDVRPLIQSVPSLKHLEIDLKYGLDFHQGESWPSIVSHLVRFDFRFWYQSLQGDTPSHLQILNSFRSSFWLEQKHWFVACQYDGHLNIFTIPRFAPKETQWPSYSCSDIESTMLHFDSDEYIQSLTLRLVDKTNIPRYLPDKVHLSSLNFLDPSIFALLSSDVAYEHIRTVRFAQTIPIPYSIDPQHFSKLFPRVEYLSVRVNTARELSQWIDQLNSLSFAYFRIDFNLSKWCGIKQTPITHQWFIDNTRRLKRTTDFQSSITNRSIRLWMSNRLESTSLIKRLFAMTSSEKINRQ